MKNEDVLNECLEAILGGEAEESCLARYPEQADELRPLLRMAVSAWEACSVSPQLEFRTRARYEYRCVVADVCAKSAKYGFRWSWRWSTVAPLALAAVMVMSGGVMAASTNTLPGQPLYGVKLFAEDVQVKLIPAGENRAMAYAIQMDRRLDEITALTGRGDFGRVVETALRLDGVLNEMTNYLKGMGCYVEHRGDLWATDPFVDAPPVAMGVPPVPTLSAEDAQSYLSASDENISIETALLGGATTPLLGELQSKAAEARARLSALLENVPDDAQKTLGNTIANCDVILNAQPAPVK